MSKQSLIPPTGRVRLSDYDPAYTGSFTDEAEVRDQVEKDLKQLNTQQEMLYASADHALLIVLQAMDTGGKDGTVTHVFRGLNPEGVQVTSFKVPTAEDLAHDFLWRIHPHTPPKGAIGVFNRSYYEDVLVSRVHELVPKKVWKARYEQINAFEALLTDSHTTILKFYLHISKDEQKRRLESRLQQPNKHWKFSTADIQEREYWDQYMEAYEAMLGKCNTKEVPWHIVPANRKWYRDYVITRTIVETLDGLKLHYPLAEPGLDQVVIPD